MIESTPKCNDCGNDVKKIDSPPFEYHCRHCKKDKWGYETYKFVSLFAKHK